MTMVIDAVDTAPSMLLHPQWFYTKDISCERASCARYFHGKWQTKDPGRNASQKPDMA